MSDTNTQFIRKYKRASKSPWDNDSSTMLWLAGVDYNEAGEIELSFNRYIYLHRDDVGRVLGISISKTMLDENPEFDSRYMEGIEMYGFLVMHIDEVTNFCNLFSDCFESVFLHEPRKFFELAEQRWFGILDNV